MRVLKLHVDGAGPAKVYRLIYLDETGRKRYGLSDTRKAGEETAELIARLVHQDAERVEITKAGKSKLAK